MYNCSVDIQQDSYYREHYDSILNKGLLGIFKDFTHRFIERGLSNTYASKILEVGAGSGYHKKFVKQKYDVYIESDLRESSNKSIVKINAERLTEFKSHEFDRIIATCLLAHLNNPSAALTEWRRCVKNNGLISIYVPCEPGLALRLFRFFTTNIKGRRRNLNHYSFHYIEHRN